MDTVEARRILDVQLGEYRLLPYSELTNRLDKVETLEIPSGGRRSWQLEFLICWDGAPDGNIRVIGSIDDGGLRAFFPLSDSFIKSPSGQFVGE